MEAAEIQVMNLDHLGLVAGIIDEIGLVEQIDQLLGQDRREKVSAGLVVKAMILNGLGFVSAPLYLFSRFFGRFILATNVLVQVGGNKVPILGDTGVS